MFYLGFFLLVSSFYVFCDDYSWKINPSELVDFVNSRPDSTWRAQTYGLKTVNLHKFAKGKLGTIMERPAVSFHPEMPSSNEKYSDKPKNGDSLPESFTWASTNRTNCSIGHIRDQANCGSCWAFSSATAFGDRLCIKSNGSINTPLSAEYLTSCHPTNYGCDGGYMWSTYNFLKDTGAITGGDYDSDEGCQPYSIPPCGFPSKFPCAHQDAYTPKCKNKKCTNDWYNIKTDKKIYKIKNYYSLYYESYAIEDIYMYGPITATFWVYPDFFFYEKGIYSHRYGFWPLGGHAVKVVGWGVENGTKYWHVANSWGTEWGENGFFRIRRGTNECSFEYGLQAVSPELNATEFA